MISLHQLEMEADKYLNKGSVLVCYVLVYTYPMGEKEKERREGRIHHFL